MSNLSLLFYEGTSKIFLTKWKVNKGFAINQVPFVIFTYQELNSDGQPHGVDQKYKINNSGIIVKSLQKKNNEVIQPNDVLLEFERCSHSTLMKDLCAVCGINIANFDSMEQKKIAENTSVSMVHSIPELRVSRKVAEDLGRADEDRLLKSRKLVLLVDLDQTIVHSTNQDVPSEITEIHHYQLYGPNSPWYHTKFRPFMVEFLEEISKFYELHICTFGARRYAHQIAHLIDPKCKYFPKDRILSRDEFFDPRSKTGNMNSLFPCGDSMVCIIDDRVDVWNYSPNVVHVKPYLCFRTDDINAPEKLNIGFDNNNEESKESANKDEEKPPEKGTSTAADTEDNDNDKKKEESNTSEEPKEDQVEQAKSDEKNEEVESKPKGSEYSNLLEDKDDYLLYLKDILIRIHKEYYDQYDRKLKYKSDEEEILIPNLKIIIPQVRRRVLHGVNIVFSGVIATNIPPKMNRFYRLSESLGAIITNDVIMNGSPKTTHLIAAKWGTIKVNKCLKHGHIKLVTPDWLIACAERWEKVDENLFALTKDTVYSLSDKGDYRKVFMPFAADHHKNSTPSTSKQDPNGAEDDSKTMLELSPLSSFSMTDLDDMGKEVDDACSEGDPHQDSSDDESDDEENSKVYLKHDNIDDDEDSMNYANEGEYPQGWERFAQGKKRKFDDEDDADEDESNDSCDVRNNSSSSSSDAESVGSVDEEMVAALEREFFKPC